MAKYDSMLVEKKGNVGYVFINNVENQNRIGRKEGMEMVAALKEVDDDPEVHVVILAAKGEYFCSGGKIDGFPDGKLVDQKAYCEAVIASVKAIHNMHKPIIAAVHANAVAGGFMYMDACDIAIVGETCKFGLPEIQRGYFPRIALATLQKSTPKKRLLEMAFTGDLVDAQTMYSWNLVNHVVPNDQVLAEAEKLAERIATYNTMSTRFGRDGYYVAQTMDIDDAMHYCAAGIMNMIWTHDARETAYAAEEGRPANYLGY